MDTHAYTQINNKARVVVRAWETEKGKGLGTLHRILTSRLFRSKICPRTIENYHATHYHPQLWPGHSETPLAID